MVRDFPQFGVEYGGMRPHWIFDHDPDDQHYFRAFHIKKDGSRDYFWEDYGDYRDRPPFIMPWIPQEGKFIFSLMSVQGNAPIFSYDPAADKIEDLKYYLYGDLDEIHLKIRDTLENNKPKDLNLYHPHYEKHRELTLLLLRNFPPLSEESYFLYKEDQEVIQLLRDFIDGKYPDQYKEYLALFKDRWAEIGAYTEEQDIESIKWSLKRYLGENYQFYDQAHSPSRADQ